MFNAVGGAASVLVSTGPGCRWTAETEAGAESWLRIDSEGRFVGPGAVSFTVQPNRSFSSRTGSFTTRNDKGDVLARHSVTQRAATCLYGVDPAALTLTASGAVGRRG
jgi:hypothetical protein